MGHCGNEIEKNPFERNRHRGELLTKNAIADYQKKAKEVSEGDNQDIGRRRALRKELQEHYDLLEIEAVNILNGYYAKYYMEKYNRVTCKPLQNDSVEDDEK